MLFLRPLNDMDRDTIPAAVQWHVEMYTLRGVSETARAPGWGSEPGAPAGTLVHERNPVFSQLLGLVPPARDRGVSVAGSLTRCFLSSGITDGACNTPTETVPLHSMGDCSGAAEKRPLKQSRPGRNGVSSQCWLTCSYVNRAVSSAELISLLHRCRDFPRSLENPPEIQMSHFSHISICGSLF